MLDGDEVALMDIVPGGMALAGDDAFSDCHHAIVFLVMLE